ncbi:MAG TPA: S8 family peptidase [Vicinamibacterales bacterium]
MTKWRNILAGTLTAFICLLGSTAAAAPRPGDHPKLDRKLNDRAAVGGSGTSRVIVVLKPGADASGDYKKVGAIKGRHFNLINGEVVSLPNNVLRKLADSPNVLSIHWDRPLDAKLNLAAVAVGARAVQQQLGYDGAGVGVAVIDSGVTGWHDDLTYLGSNKAVKVVNGQRVVQFVDFVNGRTMPYDDYGHGSHVAGIIAGNGLDSLGARAGIAPAADLVSLKVLDQNGSGSISNVIAALDWVVANRSTYNIRVVNLSVGAAVTESYWSDPLTLAAKRAVDAGVVVVTAAGNLGRGAKGKTQYGAITAPGNSPWVLTVGADSDQGTVTRTDDIIAPYSSRGPTAVDYGAKPDVVAPGTGIASLAVQGSTMYTADAAFLMKGTLPTPYKPYLSLSGTSMAAPMVAGTVALMMQANPNLTPNLAKAIIEYTAQSYHYDALTQGAGFLNTKGAVDLAKYLAHATAFSRYPSDPSWSRTMIWGNRKLSGGVIKPAGNAYGLNIVWGTTPAAALNIVWGTMCGDSECDNIVWGTDSILDGDNIVWGTSSGEGDNIVWGTVVKTRSLLSGVLSALNIVWGTSSGENDNIVWGTECGGLDCDNIVWGTSLGSELENIVWGTALEADNIVWGTSGSTDNVIWGSSGDSADNAIWGDPDDPATFEGVDFSALFDPSQAPGLDSLTVATAPTTTTTTTGSVAGGSF